MPDDDLDKINTAIDGDKNATGFACGPILFVAAGGVIAIVVGLLVVILVNGGGFAGTGGATPSPAVVASAQASASIPTGSASSSPIADATVPSVASAPAPAASPSAAISLDGHWVLATGLTNVLTDMPIQCNGCDNAGYTVTVDPPEAYIDITGTQITGGKYKTGYTAVLPGDKCAYERQAKIDATVSGGVDPNTSSGQLIIDGKATASAGCDSNYKPIMQTDPSLGHTSRLFYISGDTLYLCQGLNAMLDGCAGPNGGAAPPVATFTRQ